MPRVKPFKALIPSADVITDVVTRPIEYYGVNESNLIAAKKNHSFFNLINPKLDNRFMRGSEQENIFKKIDENLEHFLDKKILEQGDESAIYIYQIINNGLIQNGLWLLTNVDDYVSGNIKKHELTISQREKLLAEYLEQTSLDANPVLITYHPNLAINDVMQVYLNKTADIDFDYKDGSNHKIWTITNEKDIETVVNQFERIESVYIADGHHRIASIAKINKKKNSPHHKRDYKFFSSVYMDTDQLQVFEYNRIVKDLNGLSEASFLNEISKYFIVEKQSAYQKPFCLHHFAMYMKSGWYKLTLTDEHFKTDPVGVLDVSILQDLILEPILHIKNPRLDSRIQFAGGNSDFSELENQVNSGEMKVAFVLFPVSVNQIINVADANEVMPPKSTWIEPKFLVGLLTNTFT